MSAVFAEDFLGAKAEIEAMGFVPDVFLVDYHLDNGATGIEIIEALKTEFAPVRAVLLTANRDPLVQAEATTKGIFVRYKPVDTNELRTLLIGLLRNEMMNWQS